MTTRAERLAADAVRWTTYGVLMRIEAAVVNEQGVDFAVVMVRRAVLQSPSQRDEAVLEFSAIFDGLPTVLMAQDGQGTPEYYGRQDIVSFLADVPFEGLPWAEYTVS